MLLIFEVSALFLCKWILNYWRKALNLFPVTRDYLTHSHVSKMKKIGHNENIERWKNYTTSVYAKKATQGLEKPRSKINYTFIKNQKIPL